MPESDNFLYIFTYLPLGTGIILVTIKEIINATTGKYQAYIKNIYIKQPQLNILNIFVTGYQEGKTLGFMSYPSSRLTLRAALCSKKAFITNNSEIINNTNAVMTSFVIINPPMKNLARYPLKEKILVN